MTYPVVYGATYSGAGNAVTFAGIIPPSQVSFLGIGRELLATIPVPPTSTVYLYGDSYDLEDTPAFVPDMGIRAALASPWNETIGTENATFSAGGPAYLTADCYWLDNVFGDLSTASNGTLATARPLAYPVNIGDTVLYTTGSLGAVTTGSVIQISDGEASEVVVATTGSSSTMVQFEGTPARFTHTIGATAALQTTAVSYTHTFAVLNSGSGQPPVHTLTDFSGLTAGTGARYYPAACVSEFTYSSDPAGILSYKTAGSSVLSVPAAVAPTASTLALAPLAQWQSTVTIGGHPVLTTGPWAVTFARPLAGYWSPGSQAPLIFARGDLGVTGSITYAVPQDETPLLQMTGGQPTTVIFTATNGLPGVSQRGMTLQMSSVQFLTAKLSRGGNVLAYTDTFAATANTRDIGGSGGAGPATVTVINGIPAF